MSNNDSKPIHKGGLQASTRRAIDWKNSEYLNETRLFKELDRVFDICHGCRRCSSLCNAFPTLFDTIDAVSDGNLGGVEKKIYWKVVDHCHLCDMCYVSKCPYVPPHDWAIDFPQMMLRAKALKFSRGEVRPRDKILSSTDVVGSIAGIPVIAQVVNAVNGTSLGRKLLDKTLGVHPDASIPKFRSRNYRSRHKKKVSPPLQATPTTETTGKVALFATCYANRNEPELGSDLRAIFEHNGIPVVIALLEVCCGMPKLGIGDLQAVEKLKSTNIAALLELVNQGYDIVTPVPSCTLMFKHELPLLFADDDAVQRVAAAVFDPFEYLWLRHKGSMLRTDFQTTLGKISYHVSCHLRAQKIGLETYDVLKLVPGTQVDVIEGCSGGNHNYGIKHEFRDASINIGTPVFNRVEQGSANYYSSDCPMAGHQIRSGLPNKQKEPAHPLKLLRKAYGI